MPVLNDICPDNTVARRLSDSVLASPDTMASRRFRQRPGAARESWRLLFGNLTAAEITTLRTIYSTYRRTTALAWTPPGETADRAFRILDFRETTESAALARVELDLLYLPGVQPPA